MILLNGAKTTSFMPREGMIIQWPLKGQFHDVSLMVVSKNFLTVAVIENVGTFVIFLLNLSNIQAMVAPFGLYLPLFQTSKN